ncbi:MAG: hypothetical protein IH944_05370 [Armatimonadetes bacterium]|nr:hypothetical protein [Armatimonadota bacterium]
MLSTQEQTIAQEIVKYVEARDSRYARWYVGIARDSADRLFNQHDVSENNGWWIRRQAGSAAAARDIEQYLLRLGFDGGTGGGDHSTTNVYAYYKTGSTVE